MIDLAWHGRNREELLKLMGPSSVALMASPPEVLRNGDAHYTYRQSSDLYYLSGFAEPQATLLIHSDGEPFTLFVRPKDPEKEIWDGRRAGVEGAKATFGADRAFSSDELAKRLPELIANVDTLYYELGANAEYDALVLESLRILRKGERRGLKPPKAIVDPRFSLHELRLRKSAEEVQVMRKAAKITDEAHRASMARAKAGVNEAEIAALIDYTFRKRGGSGPGYTSIVGGGENATILHYIENNQELRDGDLLLIDAGCEYSFYTADVTRTFPVNGRFSEAQRKCYELVLKAELAGIEMTKPGTTIDEIHDRCVEVLTEGMVELGLLKGPAKERIADKSYRRFYMHRTSHWLGLDVHDVGAYSEDGKARPLQPGMVITIEPGLYIGAGESEVPQEFRGIGIRIEDDILVTEDGYDNLTAAVPKTVAEVEAACAAAS